MTDAPATDRWLTLAQLEEILSRRKTWIYERIERGEFPQPDEGRWYASEVDEYLRLRKAGKLAGKCWPERKRAA